MTLTLLAISFGWGEAYLVCLLVGLVLAVITGVLSGLGAHHEIGGHDVGGHDMGGHGDTGAVGHDVGATSSLSDPSIHFSPFSPVVLGMFVTVFGGVGLVCVKGLNLPWVVHLPLATLSGIAIGGLTFYIFARFVSWAQGFSQASVMEALGLDAEVIIPIPQGGMGRIAYTLGERRFTAAARSVDGQPIANHTIVTIDEIPGSTFVVRESTEEQLRKLTRPPTGEP